jgi:hypothetical protein
MTKMAKLKMKARFRNLGKCLIGGFFGIALFSLFWQVCPMPVMAEPTAAIKIKATPKPTATPEPLCWMTITPPAYDTGAMPFLVGAWKGVHCADWCGSMLWHFPSGCYNGINADCTASARTGNGIPYPINYPCTIGVPNCTNPAPSMVSGNCGAVWSSTMKPLADGFWYLQYKPGATGPVGKDGLNGTKAFASDSPDLVASTACNKALKAAQKLNPSSVSSQCFCVGPESVCHGPNQ